MYDCMVQSTYIYGIYGTYIGWHNGGQRYKRAIRRPLPPWGAPCQGWQLSARAERGKPMSVTSSWHLVNFIHIRLSASQVQAYGSFLANNTTVKYHIPEGAHSVTDTQQWFISKSQCWIRIQTGVFLLEAFFSCNSCTFCNLQGQ